MKKLALLLALIMVLSCAVACGTTEPATTGEEPTTEDQGTTTDPATEEVALKDTIVVARSSDSPTLDYAVAIDSATLEVTCNIYDGLLAFDADNNVVGALATEWEFVSDTQLRMTLRPDVLFHDGSTMTAEDVKFSLERIRDSVASSHMVGTLDHVEVVDDSTVDLIFSEPFAPVLSQLASGVPIVSKAACETLGDSFGTQPVGTGPYKFVEWVQNSYILLEAFDGYWKGVAPTQYLKYEVIPESASRVVALENGEIDVATDVTKSDMDVLAGNDSVVISNVASSSIQYMGMNNSCEPFNNVLVRQAVSYAVDRPTLVQTLFGDTATVANSVCAPGLFGYTDDVTKYDYNPEKAKELLAEAGYADGFDCELWCRDSTDHIERATIIQSNLKDVGINVELVVMEWATYLEKSGAGEHKGMYLLGWGNSTGDANNSVYGLLSYDNLGISGNRSWYNNARVNELLGLARTDTNSENRLAYYKEALQLSTEEATVLPLYYPNQIDALSANVNDFVAHNAGNHIYYGVTVNAAN